MTTIIIGLIIMFIEVPASKKSIAKRKLIYNVGVNDALYITNPVIDGRRARCPYYSTWIHMLERVYSKKFQERHPTYIGCSISPDWLVFSTFKLWMLTQDSINKHLDKDILYLGNKTYSPDTCLFVTKEINNLITDSAATRGMLPKGVSLDKNSGRYRARCSVNNKTVQIGNYASGEEAYNAYRLFRKNHILVIASKQKEPLKSALLNHV